MSSVLPLHRNDVSSSEADPAEAHEPGSKRIPFLGWMSLGAKNHLVAAAGEFVGTVLFLFFAFSGTQVANVPTASTNTNGEIAPPATGSNPALLLYISLVFGFSLAVNAWVFFRISGGLFNPAVTLAMMLAGGMGLLRGAILFVAQILGGMASAAIVSALFPGDLNVSTSLSAGTSIAQGLFIEMFLTTMLVLTIFLLASEKHKATFVAPVGIGLALFIAELTGVYYTGGSLNPCRSFGPAVVNHNFPHYHWIYWLGPALGSLLASAFYKLIKWFEYETANPGQDGDAAEMVVRIQSDRPVTASGGGGDDEKVFIDEAGFRTRSIRGSRRKSSSENTNTKRESNEHDPNTIPTTSIDKNTKDPNPQYCNLCNRNRSQIPILAAPGIHGSNIDTDTDQLQPQPRFEVVRGPTGGLPEHIERAMGI